MSKCVCKGNWRNFVKEAEPFMGKAYEDKNGSVWVFIGILWAEDDFYWTFTRSSGDRRGEGNFITCCMSLSKAIEVCEWSLYED